MSEATVTLERGDHLEVAQHFVDHAAAEAIGDIRFRSAWFAYGAGAAKRRALWTVDEEGWWHLVTDEDLARAIRGMAGTLYRRTAGRPAPVKFNAGMLKAVLGLVRTLLTDGEEDDAPPLPGADQCPPEVVCSRASDLREREWSVRRCPYCDISHRHPAGAGDEDPNTYLGQVEAGCCEPFYDPTPGYRLVARPDPDGCLARYAGWDRR